MRVFGAYMALTFWEDAFAPLLVRGSRYSTPIASSKLRYADAVSIGARASDGRRITAHFRVPIARTGTSKHRDERAVLWKQLWVEAKTYGMAHHSGTASECSRNANRPEKPDPPGEYDWIGIY